ncbi:MAG: GntR family transcriptional regulator [Acidobacteria bacterium]|nr:MAG: GntR family transcriptional regulator [Acidobacteriota bacterium]
MAMTNAFDIDARDPTPLYAQLERAIRFAIATGRLGIGDQLPTVRQLAVNLRINANTVAKVYAELERAGVVETRRGVGTFVREPDSKTLTSRRRTAAQEQRLRVLSERFLAEANMLGFSPAEVVEHLRRRVREGE